jgi:anti-anti-sigma regulatory factor
MGRRFAALSLSGVVDSVQSEQVMDVALDEISASRAKIFILDIRAVAAVDTAVANHLIKITEAASLLGCECVISGMSPAVAQSLVQLGISLNNVVTRVTISDALSYAFDHLKLQVVPLSKGGAITMAEVSPTLGVSETLHSEAGRTNVLSRCSVQKTNGCLVATLPTDLDTELVETLHFLLGEVSDYRHSGLVISLSRVDILPSKAATALVQLASAAKLLDSPAAICGIKPSLAAAMSTLGITLQDVPTARDVDGALILLAGMRSVTTFGRRDFSNPPGHCRSPA